MNISNSHILKKSPLHKMHLEHGAKMVSFGGWEMPMQYSSIIEEHMAVRNRAGLFDVSHMGQINIKGGSAGKFLQEILVSDISGLQDRHAIYSLMCLPSGGIIDDLIVYRFTEQLYMLCVNASNINKDFSWLNEHTKARNGLEVENVSDKTAMLALQGRESESILAHICDVKLSSLAYYEFVSGHILDIAVLISRTGYTGEDGFELYFDYRYAEGIWKKLMEVGSKHNLKPVGLAARDILRQEMMYPLYGNDISEDTTPVEGNLRWTVSLNKGEFIGRDNITRQMDIELGKKMVGFQMIEKGIPRPEYPIYYKNDRIGKVTSGTHSPSLGKGIGIGYVQSGYSKVNTELAILVRGKMLKAKIVKPPFCSSNVKRRVKVKNLK